MHDDRLYLPTIAPLDRAADIATQTQDVLGQLDRLLVAAGAERRHLLISHIWLSDMSLFAGMTAQWNEWVDRSALPSRSCVSRTPSDPRTLLEIEAMALVPAATAQPERHAIDRYGIVDAPGRPRMCLALGYRDWFTVCLVAPPPHGDAKSQTLGILEQFDYYMQQAGVNKSGVLSLEVWLKNMADFEDVKSALGSWLSPAPFPAAKCMRADMARAEILVEIRLTAFRGARPGVGS